MLYGIVHPNRKSMGWYWINIHETSCLDSDQPRLDTPALLNWLMEEKPLLNNWICFGKFCKSGQQLICGRVRLWSTVEAGSGHAVSHHYLAACCWPYWHCHQTLALDVMEMKLAFRLWRGWRPRTAPKPGLPFWRRVQKYPLKDGSITACWFYSRLQCRGSKE